MIMIDIPGYRRLELDHLVLDYNGTMAVDGVLLPGVSDILRALAAELEVHIITADTFGLAARSLADLPAMLTITPAEGQDLAKLDYITSLDLDRVVAIGNGRNDRRMLAAAALGIVVVQREGASMEALQCGNIVCTSILDALEMLREPRRLTATLRS
jgi:soluble P-type ATPase